MHTFGEQANRYKNKLSISVESVEIEAEWILFVKFAEVKMYAGYMIKRHITPVWLAVDFFTLNKWHEAAQT